MDAAENATRGSGWPDIAVVGAGCRYPGGVRDLDSLWRFLSAGGNAISSTPTDRWGQGFLDPDGSAGTMYSARGSFLDDVDAFDARFFGISPREAAEIDPQHRLLLTTAWEAMQDSGIPLDRWAGSRTGVYTGVLGMDYTVLLAKAKGAPGVGPYYASGKEASFGAGRIAYTFGLHGPCMMLNTACSSSLLAVHLAVQSLRLGECDAALAGGVSLMLVPELSIFMSRIEALSPTGTCRPFDTAADGVVRGEGCGLVVLKRYHDALRDGDRVLAVIKGSATVHDGRSAGLIAPNAEAQQWLLRLALENANVPARQVDYVETHCTGTSLGDHIEVSALAAVFGDDRPDDRPLLIGSHKANFGHTDSAAGILGLLKAILVARQAEVPPQIQLDSPLDLVSDGGIRVATRATRLNPDQPRTVGVSAFGLSGTNVHVVLQSPPATDLATDQTIDAADEVSAAQRASEPMPVLLASAPRPEALAEHARDLADLVATTQADNLPQLLRAASVRRTHHDYRLAVVGADGAQLVQGLRSFGSAEEHNDHVNSDVIEGRAPGVVYAFSGQGSQWPGMAVDLLGGQPVVREALSECDDLVGEYAGWSLMAELRRDRQSKLAMTEFAQPAIFAVQLALSRLWTSWSVTPVAVIGHSVGEIAAAHTAGVLDLRDAVRLVVHRGRIMQAATGSGRMAQVELSPDEARGALQPFPDVVIAAVNGPHSVVLAGPALAVEAAVAYLQATGARCLPLTVDYAFHSPAMRAFGNELEELLGDLSPKPARIPLLSSTRPDQDPPVADGAYWGDNVRDPVEFWPAVDRWLARRDATFVEIGAHPVLTRPLRDALAHRGRRGVVVSSLARGRSGPLSLAAGLASLYTAGARVDWPAVHPAAGSLPTLPPVPLHETPFWLDGLERGEQGRTAASSPGPLAVSGELRLFDADNRLVATIGELPVAAAAGASSRGPEEVVPVPVVPVPVVPLDPAAPTTPSARPVVALLPTPVPVASAVPTPDGLGRICGVVGRIAAEVLGVPGQRLSSTRGFFELGFDSFSIVELGARIGTEYGLELPATTVFQHPSIETMAEFLVSEIGSRVVEPVAVLPVAVLTADPVVVTADPLAVTTAPVAVTGPALVAVTGPTLVTPVEPIAIVGMGCRVPGAQGLDAFWSLVSNGIDATREVPDGRWSDAPPGSMASRRGGFVEDIDGFDNAFFRVSAREARSMDPQQRMFLEVAWEALEDAGVTAPAGARTSMFVGLNTVDYGQLLAQAPDQIDLYYGTGNTFAGVAGRLSYFLGARGPSLAVDTACASSLTAVHLACQSLRSGESDLAVVGGANALLTPTVSIAMSAGGALAPDGRCKTFAATADGYGRGEGAGAVVLKTLSRAMADGDRIYAVIRGSAVNHNGASGGLTVPSVEAQAEVIGAALAAGGVDPTTVDYVEAHGTGTALGDPIELAALDRALGPRRPVEAPLLVGSVKTNIGHLEAAAGIAGLIKAVLALTHAEIPAHLHFDQPSPKVPWHQLRLAVPRTRTAWPQGGHPRTVGVSAFGFTGANAHVVLTEAPSVPARATPPVERPYVLALSAASPAALEAARSRVAELLAVMPESGLADLAHTLGVRRNHLEHRLVAVGCDLEHTLDALRTAPVVAAAGRAETVRLAVVFGPSVGNLPWSRLYEVEPAFAAALDAADAALAGAGGSTSVRDELLHGPGSTPLSPAVVTAAQIAMAALWSDLGVQPDLLVGVGAGQLAAASVAGVVELQEAMAAAIDGRSVEVSAASSTPLLAVADTAGLGGRLTELGVEILLDASFSGAADAVASDGLPAVSAKDVADPIAPVRVAAELHARGCRVSYDALLAGRGTHVSGPSYPWQHRRHWIDFVPSARAVENGLGLERGSAIAPVGGPEGLRYYPVCRVGAAEDGYLAASDLVALVLDTGCELSGRADFAVRDLVLLTGSIPAIAFATGSGAHLALRPEGDEWSLSLVAGRYGARDAGPVLGARLTGAAVGLGVVTRAGRTAGPRSELASEADTARLAGLLAASWHGNEVAEIESIGVRGGRLVTADGRIAAELAGVRYAPERPPAAPARSDRRLFRVQWQPAELPGAAPSIGRWLVVPAGPGAQQGAAALTSALIEASVAATCAADLTDLERRPEESLAGIVLVATGASEGDAAVPAALTAVRALASAPGATRLWLVTQGGQDPDLDEALVPDRAAAWWLLRTLGMESGPTWGGCIDLDQTSSNDLAAVASALLSRDCAPAIEDELVRRAGRWYVPRLVPAERASNAAGPPRCRTNGRYLLLGSAAAYGEAIEALVAAGAHRWLVVRPDGPPAPDLSAAEQAWAERMVAAGAQLEFVREVPPALEEEQFAGVVIAAPPLATSPLAEIALDDVRAALRFVTLAEDLESRVRGDALDFFYVFGSAAASWGSAGLAVTAAVDGALSALVRARRAAGRAGAITYWMPGADTGELTRRDVLMMGNAGLTPLTAVDRTEAADQLLRLDLGEVAVARVDAQRYQAACRQQTNRGFLALLSAGVDADDQVGARPGLDEGVRAAGGAAELLALSPRLRSEVLLERVIGHVTDIIGEGPGSEVDPERGFFDLGLDSVMAVALKGRLDEELGVDLPVTLTFEFPTSRVLAEHLLERLQELDPTSAPAPEPAAEPAPASTDYADLDALTEEELMARLRAELAVSEQLLAGEAG